MTQKRRGAKWSLTYLPKPNHLEHLIQQCKRLNVFFCGGRYAKIGQFIFSNNFLTLPILIHSNESTVITRKM